MSDTDDYDAQDDAQIIARATAPTPEGKFTADCNRIFVDLEKRVGDGEGVVEKLGKVGATSQDVLMQALECDDPAKILHALSQDEDTAKLIAKMPPVRRAAALSAIERGEPLPTANPVPGWKQSRSDLYNPNLSDKEFSRAWDRKYGRYGLPGRR